MKFFVFFLFTSLYALNTESSYPYLSGYTWLYFSDWRLTQPDYGRDFPEIFDPERVQCGDTVFVEISCLKDFEKSYLPKIKDPIILITSNYGYRADEPLPGPFDSLLDNEKIAFWLVQNIDRAPTKKLIPIPIGNSSRCFSIGNISALDHWIQESLSSPIKSHFLYLNFAQALHRIDCTHHFQSIGAKFETQKPFESYLKDLSETIFVVSPPGNGLDCHRTWEALLMGCYPIVQSSTLNPLYQDLPVVIIDEWEEVTDDFLHQKHEELRDKTFSREKLYAPYWFKKVKTLQSRLRSQQKIKELERAGDMAEKVQTLLEEICPQEKRIALLRARIQQSEIEMKERTKGKEPPFLSFVLPCYNREKSVRETIESIYSQNLSFPFEVIAIDDASKDRSFEVLQEYERLYDNFFAFRNTVNLKAPATRNRAVALSRGTYICNADSDDVFEKDTLQPMLQAMISGGYDVAFFQELRFFTDFDRTSSKRAICPTTEISLESLIQDYYIPPCAGNRIYSKESWLYSGGYLEEPGHDSWAFSYALLANGYKAYLHPGSFYWHRAWSDQSNMWYDDLQKNVHDISPKNAVLDHPELFSPSSFALIQLYKPDRDLFMTFLKDQFLSRKVVLKSQAPLLLKARYQENKGESLSALASYTQAIQTESDWPLFIYLRTMRLALQLGQNHTALDILQKARNHNF